MENKIICNGNNNTEDKEKQIEVMSKVMQKCYEKNGLLNFKWFAESAYKCLTEDSVVISKEDKAKLVHIDTLKNIKSISQLKELLSNITAINDLMGYNDRELEIRQEEHKETARELIAKIRQFFNNVETVLDEDKYSLYPEIGYKCSEVDDFLDKLEKESNCYGADCDVHDVISVMRIYNGDS